MTTPRHEMCDADRAAIPYDGILLASFGGPEGQDDVIPFLRNVTRGRGIPDERLEEVAVHYRHYGGVSPINEHNRELKAALEAELAERGIDLPVYWGNRNWDPYLPDTVRAAHEAGARRLVGLATSAYSSYSSCRQYREDFARAVDETGLEGVVAIDKVRQYFDTLGFVAPFVEGLSDDLASLLEADDTLRFDEIEVLFTTHSVPTADAVLSGNPGTEYGEGGAYVAQHLVTSQVVADAALARLRERGDLAAALPEALQWRLVYQSRSGPPSQPWLEPDINDVIAELPAAGRRAVVVVPIGFVSDHMEVMWDLDNEAKDSAAAAGLAFRRSQTPGVHPAFVRSLVDLVVERLEGRRADQREPLAPVGRWFELCHDDDCCAKAPAAARPAEPAASGAAS